MRAKAGEPERGADVVAVPAEPGPGSIEHAACNNAICGYRRIGGAVSGGWVSVRWTRSSCSVRFGGRLAPG